MASNSVQKSPHLTYWIFLFLRNHCTWVCFTSTSFSQESDPYSARVFNSLTSKVLCRENSFLARCFNEVPIFATPSTRKAYCMSSSCLILKTGKFRRFMSEVISPSWKYICMHFFKQHFLSHRHAKKNWV